MSLYTFGYAKALVYMLQSTEYQIKPYLEWCQRTKDFSKVMYRRKLDNTRSAMTLLTGLILGIFLQLLAGIFCVWFGYSNNQPFVIILGILLIISYPITWAYIIVIPLWVGRIFIINPKNKQLIDKSKKTFAKVNAVKIAVAGSYGKTTMKEMLKTVLGEGKIVAATPANKNVSISHADFVKKLTGNEEIIILEFGEGAPGDVERFSSITQPNIGIITGIAPAHLGNYSSLKEAGKDIFSLSDYVGKNNTYVNSGSGYAIPFIKANMHKYNSQEVLGWKISDIKVSFEGTGFTMKKRNQKLKLNSGLLGRHQVGPLALVAALADNLGLTKTQIERGIAKTQAFEHRMQARALRGAWIIDDTYNGNIDGMKAGLELLSELPGKRKIYVTPGLVEQGAETEAVHLDLGKVIAKANPNKVVLMNNSVTDLIKQGLKMGKYKGEIQTEQHPLNFYTNLEHFLANGDVILLQNDWTDNYN